jgi:hypothetical protein
LGETLVAFACREEEDCGLLVFGEGGEELFAPEGPDFGRGEDRNAAGGFMEADLAGNLGEEVATDEDGVVGGGGFDGDGAHAKTAYSVQRTAFRKQRSCDSRRGRPSELRCSEIDLGATQPGFSIWMVEKNLHLRLV